MSYMPKGFGGREFLGMGDEIPKVVPCSIANFSRSSEVVMLIPVRSLIFIVPSSVGAITNFPRLRAAYSHCASVGNEKGKSVIVDSQ